MSDSCPVCDGKSASVAPFRGHARARCLSCDVHFCIPFGAANADWYAAAPLYAEESHPVPEILEPSWEQARVAERASPGEGVLDIGCGGGVFLGAALRRGLTVTGIDVQARQLEWAKQNAAGAELHLQTLEDFIRIQADRRFDLVTAFHVLEHLPDPTRFLALARDRLRAGGRLSVAVPNRTRLPIDRSVEEVDVPPHHVTYWSRDSLERALSAAGLREVRVETAPVDVFGVLTRLSSTGALAKSVATPTTGVSASPSVPRLGLARAIRIYQFKLLVLSQVARVANTAFRAAGAEGVVLLGSGLRA